MNTMLTNKRRMTVRTTVAYLDRNLLPALGEVGKYPLKGALAFAVYRNVQQTKEVISKFRDRISRELSRFTKVEDGRPVFLADGSPYFLDDDAKKAFESRYASMAEEVVAVDLQAISQDELEECLVSANIQIEPNVLNILHPMFLLNEKAVPSSEKPENNGADAGLSKNDGSVQGEKEPSNDPVLEQQPAPVSGE